MRNFAQAMKFDLLKTWDQLNLTPSSVKYKQAATVLAMRFYRQQQCVICQSMGIPPHSSGSALNVGHHITKRSREVGLVATPENIIPLCHHHHTGTGDPCPHPYSGGKAIRRRFEELLLERMPRRMEKLEKMRQATGKHDFQTDMYFWQTAWKNNWDYELACENVDIEAWL